MPVTSTVDRTSGSAPRSYAQQVERLRAQYAAIPADAPVRLAKRTSNLFRPGRGDPARAWTSRLRPGTRRRPGARTADVQGMVTYEHLVDATLPHGLMPLVVPQLKTITLGGAVTGLGIESSSFRNGLPHESVLEMDILTGDGRVVVARPDDEHADLFSGFPNSSARSATRCDCASSWSRYGRTSRLRHVPLRRRRGAASPSMAEHLRRGSARTASGGLRRRHRVLSRRAVPDPRHVGRRGAAHVSDYTGRTSTTARSSSGTSTT